MIALIIVLSLLFWSCGIENYLYLPPVQVGYIHTELNSRAEIRLPSLNTAQDGEFYYFTHFTIYYRIYISDSSETGDIQLSQTNLSRINSSLASDYSSLSYYTDNDTNVSTAIASQFSNRKYYALNLENADIDTVLGKGAVDGQVVIDFEQTPGRQPTLMLNNQEFRLYRSTGEGSFNPRPDRFFLNSSELNSSANVTATINNDVADKSVSGDRYTYVNMYILVSGSENYVAIHSRPTHIGIFRLPASH